DARWILHQHLSNVRKFSGPSLVELKLAPAVRVSDGPAMLSLALDEVGLAIIPSLLAKDALEAGRLVRVLPRWNCGSVHIYAVQPKLDIEAAKTIRFVEFLREILRSPSSE
ncbi:MAG: LysR substrate-binding domain-containing protein, partial [Myxococcota bacterium]